MPKTKLRPRYEMKNVPEQAIKGLRDYAEERGIDRGDAFAEVVGENKKLKLLEGCLEEAVNLMNDVVNGNYEPDSFTTQPWVKALEKKEG